MMSIKRLCVHAGEAGPFPRRDAQLRQDPDGIHGQRCQRPQRRLPDAEPLDEGHCRPEETRPGLLLRREYAVYPLVPLDVSPYCEVALLT